MLQGNGVAAWTQQLKVPLTAPAPLAEAAAEAAVALGALSSGREAVAAQVCATGCLPVLLNMLRSTQVGACPRHARGPPPPPLTLIPAGIPLRQGYLWPQHLAIRP